MLQPEEVHEPTTSCESLLAEKHYLERLACSLLIVKQDAGSHTSLKWVAQSIIQQMTIFITQAT